MGIRQGYQSLRDLYSAPTTPSSISSTSPPPYEALPPGAAPSILQQPTPASTPPRFQAFPSYPAPVPPSQAPSVLTPPPMYGQAPYLATPPLYQSPPPMFQVPRLAQLAHLQTPISMHTPVYQHQPQAPSVYESRPLTGHRYPQLAPPHLSQIHGWNHTPYMYAPPPGSPLDPYPLGWVPAPQLPVSTPPQSNPWVLPQYNTLNHYAPWGPYQ